MSGVTNRRGVDSLAQAVSGVLHPIFISTGLLGWLSLTSPGSLRSRMIWLALSSGFGGALPLVSAMVLRRQGHLADYFLRDPRQRLLPLLAGLVSYAAGAVALRACQAPPHVVTLMACLAASAGLTGFLSRRWKVSLHALGVCGGMVVLYYSMGFRALGACPLAAIALWARLHLGAHTPAEVLAGGILGGAVTFLFMEFWM